MRSFVYLGLLIAGSLLVKGASAETDAPGTPLLNFLTSYQNQGKQADSSSGFQPLKGISTLASA